METPTPGASAQDLRPRSDVVFTRVNEVEGILLSLASKRYYSLNETGMAIWEGLQSGGGSDGLAAALEAEYEVTREEAAVLIADFVESLRQESLVQARPPAS